MITLEKKMGQVEMEVFFRDPTIMNTVQPILHIGPEPLDSIDE